MTEAWLSVHHLDEMASRCRLRLDFIARHLVVGLDLDYEVFVAAAGVEVGVVATLGPQD